MTQAGLFREMRSAAASQSNGSWIVARFAVAFLRSRERFVEVPRVLHLQERSSFFSWQLFRLAWEGMASGVAASIPSGLFLGKIA